MLASKSLGTGFVLFVLFVASFEKIPQQALIILHITSRLNITVGLLCGVPRKRPSHV